MSEYMTKCQHEIDVEDLEAANKFWEEAKARVERIAAENGLAIELLDHDDEFLFDLYDSGEYVPTDEEVLEAIEEVQK